LPEVPAYDDGDIGQSVGVVGNLLDAIADAQNGSNLVGPIGSTAPVNHHGMEEIETGGIALVDDIEAKGTRFIGQARGGVGYTAPIENLDSDRSFEMKGRLKCLTRLRFLYGTLPKCGGQKNNSGSAGQQPQDLFPQLGFLQNQPVFALA
jgi:hypothetical protein